MNINQNKPTLTIFTPLFNRKNTLSRTYESLCRQTNKDFEWLIIDDGSTDDPYEEISNWILKDNGFKIKYIYKENGGMHTAHNTAYANIDTELNVCIDSDDYMPDNAVEIILKCWEKSRDKNYAGIIALDYADTTKKLLGTKLPENKDSTTLMGFYNNGGNGDKKLIYRTDIINSFPDYPVFDNEKYVALAYKYHLIDEKYELKILNECVCIVDYRYDGSSYNMYRQYIRNPKGFAFWRKEQMRHSINIKQRFKACIHYVSSSLLCKNKKFIEESPCKILTTIAVPFGVVLKHIIVKKSKFEYMHIDG